MDLVDQQRLADLVVLVDQLRLADPEDQEHSTHHSVLADLEDLAVLCCPLSLVIPVVLVVQYRLVYLADQLVLAH